MGTEGKVDCKRNFKRRVRSKDVGSDDSDEDYVVESEENISDQDDSDGAGNSLDGYASDETFGGSVGELQEEDEEEEEEEEEKSEKVIKLQRKRGRKRKTRGKMLMKSKRVLSEEEEEEEEDEDFVDDDEDQGLGEDDDEGGADDDEEFNPEANDFLDEDEDFVVKNKKHDVGFGKRSLRKSRIAKGQTNRRTSMVSEKPSVENGRSCRRLMKEKCFELDDDDDDDFIDNSPGNRKKSKSRSDSEVRKRRRRYVADSDSDFPTSVSSDYEFILSEEERDQVQEASKLLGDLKNSLRSSSTKKIMEPIDRCQQKKNVGRKGKEKVKELKAKVGKQVCGICLTEEDKRRSRGKLNCCSHFFCFACIMEWSKVESRCPLCKQRFKTITKKGRSTSGADLRNVVVEVPKRDQVYQPTEEEIRSFIDPYENVICTECHEGVDDGLMLLCDLCDSPAHTYCVGLGRQVPEGNWYCDGCRPVALGSSSTQAQETITDQRSAGNHTFDRPPILTNVGESSTSFLESSSNLPFPFGLGNVSSPRFPMGDFQVVSPISGAGAPTLSTRRQLHRHIQHLISNRMSGMGGRIDGESTSNMHSELLNSRMYQHRETAIRNTSVHMGERSLANSLSTSGWDNGFSSMRPTQFRGTLIQDPDVTTASRPLNLTLWPELSWANNLPGSEQVHHQRNGRSSMGSDGGMSFYGVRDENQYCALKEQLQSMVNSHLRGLSHDIELDHDTNKDIVRSSTHTILAACGLEHRRNEVQKVPAPSICNHFDRLIAGETSMMRDSCTSCFDSFVRDVVKRILNTRLPQWLSLGL